MCPEGLPPLAALQDVDPLPMDPSTKPPAWCRRHLSIIGRGTARGWITDEIWELRQPPPELN